MMDYRQAMATGNQNVVFPAIEEDLLLYLSILGGKMYSGYFNRKDMEVYSTKDVFSNTHMLPSNDDTCAGPHACNTFENMVANAIFSSSRRNGVQGIPFSDFLVGFLGEFQDKNWAKMNLCDADGKPSGACDVFEGYGVNVLLDRTAPFLASPNAEWPKCILETNSLGWKFGHLVRVCNEERREVYVQDLEDKNEKAVFLCECKHWNMNVDAGTMKKIVRGLDASWPEWMSWSSSARN